MDMWFWSIGLFLLALAIMGIELFVPSGGILGILAAAAIIGSLVCAFREGTNAGVTMLVLESLIVPIFLVSALKWWPQTPIGQRILNPPPESSDEVLPENDPRYELRALVGQLAIAKTKMLPSGIVSIGNRTFDAVGEGVAIEPGQTVRVVGVDLNRLEVRPVPRDELPTNHVRSAPSPLPQTSDDILARPIEAFQLEPLDLPARPDRLAKDGTHSSNASI